MTHLYFFLILTSFVNPAFQSNATIDVVGRAVDANGKALNVIATLYSPPCTGCFENLVPASESLDEGVFLLRSNGSRNLTLFVEEKIPFGFWSPLGTAPFPGLGHLPEFRGIKIRPKAGSRIDLGDVIVPLRYSKVVINVPASWSRLETVSNSLAMRVFDRTGRMIYESTLPENVGTLKSQSIKLALGQGNWSIQLFVPHMSELRTQRKTIQIKADSCISLSFVTGKVTPCSDQ